jgi:hypothetical protein
VCMTNYKTLIETDGGFSFNTLDNEIPTSGFMVSIPGHEARVPVDEFDNTDVAAYRAAITQRGLARPNYFVGAWLNDGYVYLDVSVNVRDLFDAVSLGNRFHQLAIYDVVLSQSLDLAIFG